jgi:3-methyladenine DNA glycosylase AlkD
MNHFETNFAMMQHHKYSLTDIENMVPWERQIYITMLIQHLKEEKQRMENGDGGF